MNQTTKYEQLEICVNGKTVKFNELNRFEKFIVTLSGISNSLLSLLTGIITSLSINFLTNFASIERELSLLLKTLSILRLLFCLVFNYYFIRFTIDDISINEGVYIKSDILPKNRESERLKQIFQNTYNKFPVLKRELALSIIFAVLMIACIIAYPFV